MTAPFGERVKFKFHNWAFDSDKEGVTIAYHIPCPTITYIVILGDDFIRAIMEHDCNGGV